MNFVSPSTSGGVHFSVACNPKESVKIVLKNTSNGGLLVNLDQSSDGMDIFMRTYIHVRLARHFWFVEELARLLKVKAGLWERVLLLVEMSEQRLNVWKHKQSVREDLQSQATGGLLVN